ncbi:MAG: MlaD family protein [Alphaproteobacteria bacterium]|uniref:MlaD family protein n=1 Tax=Candidatus Nitrobium versatile TaxID=2884831 RepID=A0A953M0W9_9BACT|nr:MlaD family protein [Candidatus Nitrobium versatile]
MFEVKKQLLWSKLKVGIVITVAVLLLLLTVFFAGGIESFFLPKVEIHAEIKDVRGLRKGSPVWISGIEVGAVKDLSLHPEYGTLVTMSIDKKALKYIRKDTNASVMTMGLLGDKYIELSNGSLKEEPLGPGALLKGKMQVEIKDIVDASAESLEKVTIFVDQVGRLLDKIEKGEGVVAKLLNDPSVYVSLKESTDTLSAMLKNFETSEGTLKMLVEDPSLYRKMMAATSSVEEFSTKLNKGNGTLKQLADDPSLYENLSRASQQLSSVLSELESGKGTAGTLLKDKELASELRETIGGLRDTVGELKELTRDIKANPRKYFKFSIF